MTAVVAVQTGKWQESLQLLPAPELGAPPPGALKVDVLSSGMAFPDILQVEGKHILNRKPPFVPCGEVAGRVTGIGEGVSGFGLGQRVFGSASTGGLSCTALMDASSAYPIPDGVSDDVAAGFELNYGTAYHSIHDLAAAKQGEVMLVLGASGGVGMAAIDIGQALGLQVVACASSEAKLQACAAAGATTLVNYSNADFKGALQASGIYGKVDIVVDPVGGRYAEPAMRALGWGGRFIVVGFAAGGTTPKDAIPEIPLNLALLNERKIIGCFWGPWKGRDGNQANRVNMEVMMKMVVEGKMRPVVSETFDLADYPAAIDTIMGRKALGKVTLRPAGASARL